MPANLRLYDTVHEELDRIAQTVDPVGFKQRQFLAAALPRLEEVANSFRSIVAERDDFELAFDPRSNATQAFLLRHDEAGDLMAVTIEVTENGRTIIEPLEIVGGDLKLVSGEKYAIEKGDPVSGSVAGIFSSVLARLTPR